MWQRAYLNRLKRDLDLWIERGWVTAANADAILASAREPGAATRRMPAMLAILGAVLIGFAVMSFVAANWQEISKLTKIVLIFIAMWGAYIAAFVLQKRGHANFAQAAVLIGLGLFGVRHHADRPDLSHRHRRSRRRSRMVRRRACHGMAAALAPGAGARHSAGRDLDMVRDRPERRDAPIGRSGRHGRHRPRWPCASHGRRPSIWC